MLRLMPTSSNVKPGLRRERIAGAALVAPGRIIRTPRLLHFASIQPVIFLVLFRYVFGGAIHTPGLHLRELPAAYTRVIRGIASDAARQALEELMTTLFGFRDEFVDGLLDQGRAEGEALGQARGEARMLLRVLEARGFTVPGDIRERVISCTDTAQLEAWSDLAATATSVNEVFGD